MASTSRGSVDFEVLKSFLNTQLRFIQLTYSIATHSSPSSDSR